MQVREGADMKRDLAAADIGARAARKSRTGLEDDINEVFAPESGMFYRPPMPGERPSKDAVMNGRVYMGADFNPAQVSAFKRWTAKLAVANPDVPVSDALSTVMRLTAVDPNNPRQAPFTVRVDPQGRGRVVMRDGSNAFNLDRDTLSQILLERRRNTLAMQKDEAERSADEKARAKLVQSISGYLGSWKSSGDSGPLLRGRDGAPHRTFTPWTQGR